jgi:stage II sporulation protein D
VIFDTIGFGHGVGMSQTGANAIAKKGTKFDEILKHYYTGVSIVAIANE